MPPTTTEGTLYCASCGDVAASLDAQENGPCCHNLPNPWHRGTDGLYNATSASEHFEEENEEEQPPHCPNCGSTEWRLTTTQIVNTANDDEPDGTTIWFDWGDFELEGTTCRACGQDMPRHYSLESM